MRRRAILTLAAAMPMAGLAGPAAAAPAARLWDRWSAHDPAGGRAVDHRTWDRLLTRYRVARPDGIAYFRYGSVSVADRDVLARYVDGLAAVDVDSLGRDEQFAFWVNLYNALTVKLVLDHYPVDGIRDIDISPGLFADGPWGATLATIKGEAVSLDDIEHRILRPIWRDPRIHYAVNCASIGCPNLPPVAFRPDRTATLLRDGAAAYVNHPRGARVDRGRLRVSSLYVWFKEDFGGDDAGVIDHLRAHASDETRAALAAVDRIGGHDYDWRLNGIDGAT